MKRSLCLLSVFVMLTLNINIIAKDRFPGENLLDIEYEYTDCGIHYVFLVSTEGYDKAPRSIELIKMWHDSDVEIPDCIKLPSEIDAAYRYWEDKEYRFKIKAPYDIQITNQGISKRLTTFKAVDLGDNRLDSDESSMSYYLSSLPIINLQTESLISTCKWVRNFSGGIFLNSQFFSDHQDRICSIALPYLAPQISYEIPSFVTYQHCNEYFRYLRFPIKFNGNYTPELLIDLSYYPFGSINLPENYGEKTINISNSSIKTFERCSFKEIKNTAALEAAVFPEDLKDYSFLEILQSSKRKNLKYIEFKSTFLDSQYFNSASENIKSQISAYEKEPEVVVYVSSEIIDDLRQLKNRGLFPKNALLKVVEDFVYLSPELDNSHWVNNDGNLQSQFIYSTCRFGESDIAEVKWETTDDCATVDADGIVTIHSDASTSCQFEVRCIITDNTGNKSVATKIINVANPEWTDRRLDDDIDLSDCMFEYEHEVEGIHYLFEVAQKDNFADIEVKLLNLWHDEDAMIPDQLNLPRKIYKEISADEFHKYGYSKNDIQFTISAPYSLVLSNNDIPEDKITFNVVNLQDNKGSYKEDEAPSPHLLVKEFKSNRFNTYKGALIRSTWSGYEISQSISALPVLRDVISFECDIRDVTLSGCSLNSYLRYPIIINMDGLRIDDAFDYYPFISVTLPDSYRNSILSIDHSKIKVFENASLSTKGATELEAVKLWSPDNVKDYYFGLVEFYKSSERGNKLKYIELRGEELRLFDFGSDSEKEEATMNENDARMMMAQLIGEKEVVTFVNSEQVSAYKSLQEKGLFPSNADIQPVKDYVYLCKDLDQGQWVKSNNEYKSQFIYGACRFGNSEIIDVKWESDNKLVTVDENGVVTIKGFPKIGEQQTAEIKCTLECSDGSVKTATRRILLEESSLSDYSGIEEPTANKVKPTGVFNLQGIRMGELTDNLPAGIYIVVSDDTVKKICVR